MNPADLYLDAADADADVPSPRYRHGMRVEPIATTDVPVTCEIDGQRCDAVVTLDEYGGAWVTARLDGELAELTDAQREAVVMAAMRI